MSKIRFLFLLAVNSFFFLGIPDAGANPLNPTVTSGSADFTHSAKTLEVTASDHSIISWESFSIDAGEVARFNLPNEKCVVLNRVSSLLPSTIDGFLNSNGIVYLINPSGILITPNGVIDTAGFLASTLDISDQDFLKQGDLLFSGDSIASVINQGSISCWNGDAILIAAHVKNENSLEAFQGTCGLGAGQEIFLIPEGKERISVRLITAAETDSIGVHQTGSIKAIQAELKADGNLYAYAIKNEGIINATGCQEREGRIFLVAESGYVTSSGMLAAVTADQGGEIHLLGEAVSLTDKAEISVSGNLGGGTILIGGDFQGGNSAILNARNTFVEPAVIMNADALIEGDGGKVIVWADKVTAFYGNISAKGGENGGDGGFIEVSGKENLSFSGLVNTLAPQGKDGTLLLDPTTVTISAGADAGFAIGACGPPKAYVPTANTGTVNIANLITNLTTCDVTITSTSAFAGNGNVTFSAPFAWSTALPAPHSLTINAFANIAINAAITNTTTGNPGSIVLNAGGVITSSAAGVITFGAAAGSLTMTAVSDITFTGDISYSSPAAFSITSNTGNIQDNTGATIALNTAAPFSMTATAGNIFIFNQVRNVSTGAINITCGGMLNVGTTDLIHPTLPAQIGSAGGDLTFDVGGDVIVEGGFSNGSSAQIGFDTAPVTSNIIFTRIGGNLILTGGFKQFGYALIGHGSQTATGVGPGGVFTGNITIGSALNPVGGDVLLMARSSTTGSTTVGMNSFAQIGHLRSLSGTATTATGNIDVSHVLGEVSLISGNQDYCYTMIGHGGAISTQSDSFSGTVKVHSGAAKDISLLTGTATQTFSAIGHAAYLNAPGAITINSSLIEVVAGNSIAMTSQRSTAIIGAYVRAGSGSGNVTVTNINVQTLTNDLLMTGNNPGGNFNGVFMGAITHVGGAPIIPAGSASSNLSIDVAGLMKMQTGSGGTVNNNFSLVQNGIGTPIGGPFSTTINVGATLSLFGGNNFSEINSIGPLTINCGGVLSLAASPFVASLGDAKIMSAGTTNITANAATLLGFPTGPKAAIENSLMDLTITATNDITLYNHVDIELTGGSGTLNITSTAGSLSAISDVSVRNLGTGPVVLNINQSGFVEGGFLGSSMISSLQNLTATFGENLFLTSTAGGSGSITSNGNTSITATNGGIFGIGEVGVPVTILNTAGNLTLTAQTMFFEAFSRVNLSSGAGTLTLNATGGDIYLGLNSTVDNAGTGPSFVTTTDSLLINSDILGPSSITAARALTVAAADRILMLGVVTNPASITAGQNNLSITASNATLGPNALIALNGGSGQLTATIASDLLIFNNSSLSNLGTGNTLINAGVTSLIGGADDAQIVNSSGTLTINLVDNLNLVSNIKGSATIVSGGPMTINAQNFFLGGLAAGQQSSITGSAGDMLLIAQNDITLANNSLVQNLGPGQLTLVVDQQVPLAVGPGRFILDPDAQVTTASGINLRIFTSQPNGVAAGNLAFGQANGNFVTMGLTCPFDAPPASPTYQYSTFYNTFGGGFGVPFTIFFKAP